MDRDDEKPKGKQRPKRSRDEGRPAPERGQKSKSRPKAEEKPIDSSRMQEQLVDVMFNGSERCRREMNEQTFNRMTEGNKHSLAKHITRQSAYQYGQMDPPHVYTANYEKTEVHTIGAMGALQIRLSTAHLESFETFACELGKANFECYQRTVHRSSVHVELEPSTRGLFQTTPRIEAMAETERISNTIEETSALIRDIKEACKKKR